MSNGRVAACSTIVQVISGLAMCPVVCSPSGIWGITTLSYASTTAMGRVIIVVSIVIAKTITVDIIVTVSISIAISIAISISVSIYISIYVSVYISISNTIAIVVDVDTFFHM